MGAFQAAEPRVAIVTGGSRGIGRSVVERLAGDGFSVVVNYVSNESEAAAAVAAAQDLGSQAIAVAANVGDEQEVAAMFDRAEQELGGVDVVVHCAGLLLLSSLRELDLADLDRMHRVNIRGTFVVDQQAARRVRPGGSIINFSSTAVARVAPTYIGYVASKAAVEAMSFQLAQELRGRDVTVNAIAPGPTATDMFLDGKTEEQVERQSMAPPLERLGTADDIAALVAFLASPAGRWVNAQTIRANGGIV